MTTSHHTGSFGSAVFTLNMVPLASPDSSTSNRSRVHVSPSLLTGVLSPGPRISFLFRRPSSTPPCLRTPNASRSSLHDLRMTPQT